MHHRTERGLFVFAPFPSSPPLVSTLEWDPADDGDQPPLTLGELRDSVRRVLGTDVPLGPPEGDGPHLLRRLTGGNTRLADRFRDGRVLLVGDAAHVHSSIGGPGLNLGLQDAVNLGWKLAAEIHGWAPPGLLDSYEAERRPVAHRVVMHTQAQSALIAPGTEVTALRELFTELLGDRRNVQHIADLMAGADIRYGTATGDTHPLSGRWAPDTVLGTVVGTGRGADPARVRLAELTRDARPLLLDLTGDASFARELSGWHDRVDAVTARSAEPAVATALLRAAGPVRRLGVDRAAPGPPRTADPPRGPDPLVRRRRTTRRPVRTVRGGGGRGMRVDGPGAGRETDEGVVRSWRRQLSCPPHASGPWPAPVSAHRG